MKGAIVIYAQRNVILLLIKKIFFTYAYTSDKYDVETFPP